MNDWDRVADQLRSTLVVVDNLSLHAARRDEMDAAERAGVEAGQRAVTEDTNPYIEGDPCRIMWLSGWLQGDLTTELRKARAVMLWAQEQVGSVAELARGLGQEEIALKLGTIAEKLGPYLADEPEVDSVTQT